MGKINNRNSMVSTRRRLIKASSGVGVKKSRSPAKVSLPPPPPPPQSLVVDEDSGFGGDQSLDSESSVLSTLGPSGAGVASLPSVLPSLAMVPQAKLLLVSLLQGAGGVQGTGTSQKTSGNIAVGAFPPTTQASVSNGTNQTGNTHGAVMSSGADKEGQSSQSVRPLLAAASLSLQGATGTDVLSELPAASTNSPSNYPSEPVAFGNTGHKVVENKFSICDKNLHVDLGGEEAQELPASRGTTKTHSVPPLISFRDVSLLSSLNPFQGSRGTCGASLLCVDGTPQPCGRSNKILKSNVPHTSPPLTSQLSPTSSDGTIELKLITQPEEQHRARYQTEGSRGAVKDRTGLGHPTVKLCGYNKPTVVQVFVGSDTGRTGPHMFYQVCRVSGKNSTPCKERRLDGTALIEASLDPETNMIMSCDCVGILKERNVDVEHRFKAAVSRGRKKSTKCRLVFRTFVTLTNGTRETLQVVSQPIACTQPPGVPEICRKSLTKCSLAGGEEMFILGKNFLKDTVVIFHQNGTKSQPIWEEKVSPDKETLQSIHLIVTVPKYYDQSITEEVTVDVIVSSGGKTSECHSLTYVPLVTKRELPIIETQEDNPLPKGVSPCALQLNRHYAETGTLPTHLSETTAAPVLATSDMSAPRVPTTQAVVPPLRVSHLMLNSASSKKTNCHAQRYTSRIPKTSLHGRSPTPSTRSRLTEVSVSSVSDSGSVVTEKRQERQGKVQGVQGTVSLESLVEMLKVVQKFPADSNIHTSVLQLVEELVKSMKKNISSPCKTEIEEELVSKQDKHHRTSSETMDSDVLTSEVSGSCGQQSNKTQKLASHSASPVSQGTLTSNNPSSNVTLPIATTVSLLPLTLFSAMPSTVSSGSRVARVAPINPVAPTTVVSSPGLTRTVRLFVGEASNFLQEPPVKKQREGVLPMDYQLLRNNRFEQGSLVSSNFPDTVVTQSRASTTLNPVTPLLPSKVVSNQCSSDGSLNASSPTMETETCRLDLSTSEEVMNASSQHINETQVDSPPPLTVYQPISQSVMHNIGQATTQQNVQSINVNQRVTQTTCLDTARQTSQTISQLPTPPDGQIINQHASQQNMTVHTSLPVSVSDPLLSQSTRLCPLLTNRVIVTSTTTSQVAMLPSTPLTSSLTRSDPLLSQSSPVAPIHIDANTPAPVARNEPVNTRARGDPLMAPNPTATQVSMQNEVTSAINLSETELLNYFDPNCFDNV
ncbi:nuclear factor of activated T-cells 5-like isoform X1 [Homarus americanus]|uniref:nuclear factor of activated T-cells 5-like isoform X1 n=1 Tax=Homarus americanus TaxID=6706 RepID=UPI001C46A3D7|nr:nuclear factor of activated T-cells 5-like isoform X1 [Homarus americanus]XP_042234248.1 nuclear factor of activated T-cells 5-like isoform X1 [Homarus americanus]